MGGLAFTLLDEEGKALSESRQGDSIIPAQNIEHILVHGPNGEILLEWHAP